MRRVMAMTAAALGVLCAPTPATAAPRATAPPGYVQEQAFFNDAAGSYVDPGYVTCPTGTVVWGGGAGDLLPVTGESLVSSTPMGNHEWFAQYNNASSTARMFEVDAICARKPGGYAMPFTSVADPAGHRATATVTCPPGTVVLSGGVQTTADAPGSFLLSAWPAGKTSFAAVNYNGTTADLQMVVVAVCGNQPPGYKIVSSTIDSSSNATYTTQACPTGTSVIGGGIRVAKPSKAVVIAASTGDIGNIWEGRILDPTASPAAITTKAICAA